MIQNEFGICGSFYFRMVRGSFDEGIIHEMVRLGHEIGYHYEDMDFAKMLSFGMVISKKSPPIINLDKIKEKDTSPLSKDTILCERWKALWLNCDRQNDLTLFEDLDANMLAITHSAEWNTRDVSNEFSVWEKVRKQKKLLDSFYSKAIERDTQIQETGVLYQEFLELERFADDLWEYSYDLNTLVKKMLRIPEGS